jgi:hypothetical protein
MCLVPFVYSFKPKRVSEIVHKLMPLPQVEGVFNFDVEKLICSPMTGSEKKDLIFQLLTLADTDNLHNQLKRQCALTDFLILREESELLLDTMETIVKKKAYQCKIIIRSILLLNKKDEKYFERTKVLVKSMVEGGWSSLSGD